MAAPFKISGEGKVGIALALLGVAATGAIMIWPTHTEIGWAGLIASVIGFLALAYHHWSERFGPITRSAIFWAMIGFDLVLIFVGVYRYITTPHIVTVPLTRNDIKTGVQEALAEGRPIPTISLLEQCNMFGLPISVAPGETAHFVPLNPRRLQTEKLGLWDQPNTTGKPQQWPSPDNFKLIVKKSPSAGIVSKCTISNHGNVNVLSAALRLDVSYSDDGSQNNRATFTAMVGPIDIGQEFTLYIVNECPVQMAGAIQDEAKALIPGDDRWKSIKLIREHRTPIEPIFIFFPSNVNWLDEGACS